MVARGLVGAVLGGVAAGAAVARVRRGRRRIDFAGRGVVVVGGSRGLGLAMARSFVAEGARVALIARESEALRRAEAELASQGNVVALACDLREPEAVAGAIERAATALGRLDVLINNAGSVVVGPLAEMEPDDFALTMNLHFWAPLHAMRAAIPWMRRQGLGRIANVASIGGLMAIPHMAPYSASKFALVGLSDAFRAELAGDNILVTTVSPGLLRTGSPVNALFKGRRAEEYRWFASGDNAPGLSIDADRAARRIVEACRHGDPSLTISWQAKAGALANALAPGLVAGITRLATQLLPGPAEADGGERRSGWDSRDGLYTDWLEDRQAENEAKYNQRLPNAIPPSEGAPAMADRDRSAAPLPPTQAEGERDPNRAAEERGATTPNRRDPANLPSQAEGDRQTVEADLRERGLDSPAGEAEARSQP